MRVIVNLHSKTVIDTAGWKARAIQVNDKNESSLNEVLDTVKINNEITLSDIIIEKSGIKDKFTVYVNGQQLSNKPDFNLVIKDNVQIHVMEKYFKDT